MSAAGDTDTDATTGEEAAAPVPDAAPPADADDAGPGPTRARGRGRRLDPDALAALEEQRDFLLRSLRDLEREREAGDVDEDDYRSLHDDYTVRAARVIRAIEAHGERAAAARRPRRRGRAVAVAGAVVVFAVLAGVLMAQAAGRRDAGDTLSGNTRETTRTELDRAVGLAAGGDYEGAIAVYDEILADQPDNVEALTFKGWFQVLSGDESGVVTLIDAARTDPDYPAAHAFLAVAFQRLGRPETALAELDRLDALDPPPDIARMVEGLREELEAEVGQGDGQLPG